MFLKNFEIKRVYIIQVQPSTNISLYRMIKHSVIHLKKKKDTYNIRSKYWRAIIIF